MSDLFLGKWDFIFLLGEPGGGKGTLLENIRKYWLPDLRCKGMGDIFREKAKSDPEIKSLIEQGVLISDSIVVDLFKGFATENAPGLIDGFPRSREQALYAIKLLKELNWRVLVIDLRCKTENIIKRLLSRGRLDDKLDIIYKRNLDHNTVQPIILKEIESRPEIFDLIVLDCNVTPDMVCQEFLTKILRHVDVLDLEGSNYNLDFSLNKDETSIDPAINRVLGQLLLKAQEKIG